MTYWQALSIYRLYLELRERGIFEQTLKDVYECGRAFNWTPSAANLGATFQRNPVTVTVGTPAVPAPVPEPAS